MLRLVPAVQVQIVGRLDTWVGHGLRRATTAEARLRALVQGVFSFVEADQEAWGVLGTSGGFDHPALHGVRARWASALCDGTAVDELRAQVAVGALLGGVGSWVNRGIDPDRVVRATAPLLAPAEGSDGPDGP